MEPGVHTTALQFETLKFNVENSININNTIIEYNSTGRRDLEPYFDHWFVMCCFSVMAELDF